MIRTSVFVGLLSLVVLCAIGHAQEPVLHYTFDEESGDATDFGTGIPAPGVFQATATRTTNTPGGFSPFALDLSAPGSDSWVNGGDAAKVDTLTQFTMTTWLNLQGVNLDEGGSGNVRLLAKQTDGAFDGFSWNLNNPNEGERSVDNFRLGMFIGGEDSFGFGQSTEDLGAGDKWVFLATTYDGTEDFDNMFFYWGDETTPVSQLGETLSVFAGQVKSSAGRATVNVGFTDAVPGVDFSAVGFQDDVRIYDTVLNVDQLEAVRLANLLSSTPGDVNGDGRVDADDIDTIALAVREGQTNAAFDVNGDSQVDSQDHTHLVTVTMNTWIGDSNLDGEFNSGDLVAVFTAGEYEDGIAGNSLWATGDWNGDGDFSSGDLVVAFQDGGFEVGPRAQAQAVPEPSCLGLLLCLLTLAPLGRRGQAITR